MKFSYLLLVLLLSALVLEAVAPAPEVGLQGIGQEDGGAERGSRTGGEYVRVSA